MFTPQIPLRPRLSTRGERWYYLMEIDVMQSPRTKENDIPWFFTCPGYLGLATSHKNTLIDIGAVWPDEESKAYWASLLGPPTGSCRNIRELFGYDEKPGAIQSCGTPLTKLETNVANILSFVVEPLHMHIICTCSRSMRAAAMTPNAWAEVVVDAATIRPGGARAHVHFKLWKQAHVIPGPWAYSLRT